MLYQNIIIRFVKPLGNTMRIRHDLKKIPSTLNRYKRNSGNITITVNILVVYHHSALQRITSKIGKCRRY